MQVNLEKLKPVGIVLILGCAVLAFILCMTVDIGVPEKYESLHSSEYYRDSADNLNELIGELRENVFPELQGIVDCRADTDAMTVIVVTERGYTDKVRAVLERDFGEGLFNVITEE